MNKTGLFYGAIGIALLSLCVLYLFRIVPTSQIWEKYNLLYVDVSVPVQDVKEALISNGIDNVLYPDHAHFPKASPLAPVQYYSLTSGFSYEQLQTSFFFDKDKNYNLYYIPDEYQRDIQKILSKTSFTWGLDTQAHLPALPFIISFILASFLFYYCKNKVFFACIQGPFLLYTLVAPYYHIAASVCIFSIAVFYAQRIWGRDHFKQQIMRNIFCIIALSFLCIGSILLGFKGMLLLIFTSLTAVSLAYCNYYLTLQRYSASFFQPIRIHTAKSITIRFNKLVSISSLVVLFLLTLFALINIQPGVKNTEKALQFPSPSGYTVSGNFSANSYEKILLVEDEKILPDFTDFISTAWHFETYPFIVLSNNEAKMVKPGDTIERTDYVKNGYALEERKEVVAIFDDAYIQRILSSALASTDAGAEKLLASQDGFTRIEYASSGTAVSARGGLIFLLLIFMYYAYVFIMQLLKRR